MSQDALSKNYENGIPNDIFQPTATSSSMNLLEDNTNAFEIQNKDKNESTITI